MTLNQFFASLEHIVKSGFKFEILASGAIRSKRQIFPTPRIPLCPITAVLQYGLGIKYPQTINYKEMRQYFSFDLTELQKACDSNKQNILRDKLIKIVT